jgi:hypothetical protein
VDAADPAPRFLADAMLVRLARWLRAIGHDVLLAAPGEPDAEVARRAHADGRWLLTCDRALAEDPPPGARHLLLRSGAPLAQLLATRDALGLPDLALRFTRCLLCNAPLVPLAADARAEAIAAGALPATLAGRPAADAPAWRCAGCARLYWEGSHTRRMRAALARAVGHGD